MTDVLETLKKLPARSYDILPSDKRMVICVDRGQPGYSPVRRFETKEEASAYAEHLNKQAKITPAQREAMLAGSMFGWHVPAADPDSYQ